MTMIAEPSVLADSPLRCERIFKGYASRTVLKHITLSLPPGSILGLVGRSGAGKTTLIRILLGLLVPDAGTATVLDEPALALTDSAKTRLGYVPQQPDALGWMQVGAMLAFVGSFYPKWDHQYVADSLLRWNIAPSRPLAKLSPGERQRVALIRALALRPELLILDEPAAALDPVARRDLLRELALRGGESGATVLFSTHIVSDLERVASHIACLHDGRLIVNTAMDSLKETHALLHLDAGVASTLPSKLPGELKRRRRTDGGVSLLLYREEGADWPAIGRSPGAQLEGLGLEDLFIELTT
jgi:ABC-2 type transport system ATP-binding protein